MKKTQHVEVKVLESAIQDYYQHKALKMVEELTTTEFKVYKELVDFITQNGKAPILHELAPLVNLSHEGVRLALKRLELKGYIINGVGPRNITLVNKEKVQIVDVVKKVEEIKSKLEVYDNLLSEGIIDQAEYNKRRSKLLDLG